MKDDNIDLSKLAPTTCIIIGCAIAGAGAGGMRGFLIALGSSVAVVTTFKIGLTWLTQSDRPDRRY